MKNHVFIKVSYQLIDEGGFIKKLRDYVGDIRFEAQDVYDVDAGRIPISFWTDKVEIKEGESRQVDLTAKMIEGTKDWEFVSINK